MQVINETPLRFGYVPGRLGFPKHSLTLVVRGTFDLVPGEVVTPLDKQPFPSGDEPYPDDESGLGGPRYSTDFAHTKPRADVLVVGKCHPPGGKATRSQVTVRVGKHSHSLRVTGHRVRSGGRISEPQPFSQMELRWENSYGGPTEPRNPVGKGAPPPDKSAAQKPAPMPNIDGRAGAEVPAGLAPRSHGWKDRSDKLGTYGEDYVDTRWPWFAADFDPGFFNAAVPELQIEGFLRGDEKLSLTNLHPEHATYETQLPGIRPRCFLNEAVEPKAADDAPGRRFREVPLRLDTLWIDMEAEQLSLVWRGVAEVSSEDFEELLHALVISEEVNEQGAGLQSYEGWLRERCTELRIPFDPAKAKKHEGLAETGATAWLDMFSSTMKQLTTTVFGGKDPPAAPSASPAPATDEDGWTAQKVVASHAAGESLADADLAGLDLSGLDLSAADLHGATLTGAKLNGTLLEKANLGKCVLADADLDDAKLQGANLEQADLTHATLRRADLSGASLGFASFAGATLEEAVLDGVRAIKARFVDAVLTDASLVEADLSKADFNRASFAKADMRRATLREATLESSIGAGVDLSDADLTEVRAAGCNLARGKLTGANANESIWVGAKLQRTDFTRATLTGADFEGAQLERAKLFAVDARGAKLPKANLRGATLTSMSLFEASLGKADLTKADLRGSNLYAAQLSDAVLAGAKVQGANLKKTRFESAVGKGPLAPKRRWPF